MIERNQLILIRVKRPNPVLINKKRKLAIEYIFAFPADPRVKINKSEKRNKYLDLARELGKLWTMRVTVILMVVGVLEMVKKVLGKKIRGIGEQWKIRDHLDHSIVKVVQNTEKSPKENYYHFNSSKRLLTGCWL